MRLMYWPNEAAQSPPSSMQIGPRAAFRAMRADGLLTALDIWSPRAERAGHASLQSFEAAAFEHIRNFAPNVLFVQHLTGTDVSEGLWLRIRAELPGVTIAYHEADPFDRFVKRVDAAMIGVLLHAHMIFAVGLGSLAALLEQHARVPVFYSPHSFARDSFGESDPSTVAKTCDLVMIGNRGVRRKLKFLYVPGGRRRADFAGRLSRIFGQRFFLYGRGWDHLPSARGMLPFLEQERAIQASRISVNWDHFDEIDFYFSDRLPISLVAGVPHVTTWHAGYDEMFAGVPGLYACKTVPEAVEVTRWLLSRPDEELAEEGLAARRWARAHLEANDVYRRAVQKVARHHVERTGG